MQKNAHLRGRYRAGVAAAVLAATMAGPALADPVGSFRDTTLTLSRWAGDPWTAAQVKAAEAWNKATGAKLNVPSIGQLTMDDIKQVL